MAKKIVEAENGLKDVAVAVGSALGKLAHRLGLGETPTPPPPKPPEKAIAREAPASKKKVAAKKKMATKKAASLKKVKSPAKRK